MSVIYGYVVQGQQDSIIGRMRDTINYFCITIKPGAYAVDAFPFRKLF